MTPSADMNPIIASYQRCMSREGFTDTFYELFLASSSEVTEKFQFTDMKHRKLMLRESLLMMILFSQDPTGNRVELLKLAELHDRKHADVPPRLYDLWLDTLCIAVERHDPEFTPQMEELWRNALKPGIDVMVSHY